MDVETDTEALDYQKQLSYPGPTGTLANRSFVCEGPPHKHASEVGL